MPLRFSGRIALDVAQVVWAIDERHIVNARRVRVGLASGQEVTFNGSDADDAAELIEGGPAAAKRK